MLPVHWSERIPSEPKNKLTLRPLKHHEYLHCKIFNFSQNSQQNDFKRIPTVTETIIKKQKNQTKKKNPRRVQAKTPKQKKKTHTDFQHSYQLLVFKKNSNIKAVRKASSLQGVGKVRFSFFFFFGFLTPQRQQRRLGAPDTKV